MANEQTENGRNSSENYALENSCKNEEIERSNDSENQTIHSVKRSGYIRNLIGFWLLGLCNNYPYVIMLSAAFDLLHPQFHDGGTNKTSAHNGTICNDVSTGAILLADILPSLFIKLVAPFIALKTNTRVLLSVVLCSMSFLITSLSSSNWQTFLGVICAALSSGLGEVTFLSYSSFFNENVISTWSSGTGGAGVLGALSYASLRAVLSARVTLQIMFIMPALTVVTFWVIIVHPTSEGSCCKNVFCSAEKKPILENDINISEINFNKRKFYTWRDKIRLLKPLLKYMIPLGLVYFAEYFINQGLMELLYFENASSWLDHGEQYRWYQVDYQVGVLISRSSVNILQINKLWILPILQVVNAIFLLLNVCYSFLPNIWIVLAIIFYEGLLGGSAYVNTFFKISKEINEDDREFSMGIASLGDSMGIALAGIVALPVHDALCKIK